MAKTDGVARIIALAALGKNGGGSTGGTTNYLELANKPKINNVELTGNKTLEDLGINIPDLENYYTKDMVNEAFLTKTNTTSFIPTGDYNPATKKYVDDSKNYVGEYKFLILDDIYLLSKEYFDSVLLPAVKSVGWEKVVVILSHSIGYNAMGLYMFHQKIESTDEDGNAIQTIIFETIHPDIWEQYKSYYTSGSMLIEPTITQIVLTITNDEFANATFNYKRSGSGPRLNLLPIAEDAKNAPKVFIPTYDAEPATKKYVDDNVKIYTAGENITISEDNVISANVSGGTDTNAVYTYYAPYSDEDWFTEGNVANILQTVKDKGYSNFELCTLNGSHYALRKGGNLQTLTTTEEYYDLEYLQNDLKYYTWYTFSARLDENGKIVVGELLKNSLTAEEMAHGLLWDFPGYDQTASHLILQANNGNLEWDSSLDGGIFGDSYTDPAYYTEKQVDKIVTDTVNEALGGKY